MHRIIFYVTRNSGDDNILNLNYYINRGVGYGAGFMVNANDIAGNYAGIVFGISNTIAIIPGIIAPYIVGALTSHVLIFKKILCLLTETQ
jgi:hypothetical protein